MRKRPRPIVIPDWWREQADRRRLELGLTQAELGKKAGGFSGAAVSNLLRASDKTPEGKRRKAGNSRLVEGICRELGIAPPWVHVEPELLGWVDLGRDIRAAGRDLEQVIQLVRGLIALPQK